MTIKKKIDNVVSKAGHVTADFKNEKRYVQFCVRMSDDLSNRIDTAIDTDDMIGITKTGFILQAIQEKLKRMDG